MVGSLQTYYTMTAQSFLFLHDLWVITRRLALDSCSALLYNVLQHAIVIQVSVCAAIAGPIGKSTWLHVMLDIPNL